MLFYLNLVFGWIAMISAFFMTVILILRISKKIIKLEWVKRLNRFLRRNHKSLGIILIIFGLAHGILSSDKAFGFNLGTISWITSILLGLSFVYRKRFRPQKAWMTLHRFLSAAFVALFVFHILDVGGFVIDDVLRGEFASASVVNAIESPSEQTETPSPQPTQAYSVTATPDITYEAATENAASPSPTPSPTPSPAPTEAPQSKYIDGTYEGTADGFRPGLTVEVEIQNDIITSVKVISHNEVKERYWGYPVANIPQWIVDAQSTDVDTVSGATYTSTGIIAAVDKALQKALR